MGAKQPRPGSGSPIRPAKRYVPQPCRTPSPIRVNQRAPVLTLWAAVVAERLGYPPETTSTVISTAFGRAAGYEAETYHNIEVIWLLRPSTNASDEPPQGSPGPT